MSLQGAELRTLAAAEERPTASTLARAKRVCEQHGLVTESELAEADRFLADLKAQGALFRYAALAERRAILALMQAQDPQADIDRSWQQEAAAFAMDRGRTAAEFVDYFLVYLQLASRGKPSASASGRRERAETALAELIPILFQALDCPRIDGPPGRREIAAAIEEWLLMGRRLGFTRLSRGVQQAVANAGLNGGETEEQAERIVSAYLAGAQSLLLSSTIGEIEIDQDGARFVRLRSASHEAMVHAGRGGIITLNSYCRLAEPPAQPSAVSTRRKADVQS